MGDGSDPFRFAYDPGVIRYGEGSVAHLGDELATLDCEGALVVTGRTVGTVDAVMDPIRDGIGDRLAGIFAETTPEKRLSTALDGADAYEREGADAIVAVGGGSTMDAARAVATLAARDIDADDAGTEFVTTGTLSVPDETPPILAVPTTLSGADLSTGAGLQSTPEIGPVETPVSGGIGAPTLGAAAAVYDPGIVATTPRSVLTASAMNGFDKGLESLYSRHATAITDGTAARGLRRFAEGLLAFGNEYESGIPAATEGLLLVQYGASRGEASTFSLIHALAKPVAEYGGVQQGVGHAIVAPATLWALFEDGVGRQSLVADALGVSDADDPAAAAVDRVAAVRDALGVPTRLRDLDGVERTDLATMASQAASHSFVGSGPAGFDPDPDWFEAVLENAW